MKDDRVLVEYILDCLSVVEDGGRRGYEEFLDNRLMRDGMIRNLQVAAQAARSLSPDLRANFPEVPWHALFGFRNLVVHEYWRVDLSLVWQLISNDVPMLQREMERILESLSAD